MPALKIHLEKSGNNEKFPLGPIIPPSPGPTLDIDVAAPEIAVTKSNPLIDKRVGQIISMTGSEIQVMDGETFETVDIQMVDEEVDGKLEQGQDIEYWNVMGRTKIMRIKTS